MCKVISSWHLTCCQMIQALCTDLDVSGQRTTYIPGLVTSSENMSMSSPCDQAAGPQDSLFVQTQDQAHSIESAVITACAQNTVYTLQFLSNTTHAVLLDKVLCKHELPAVCSRSSQLCVVLTEVFTETQVVPNRQDIADHVTLTGRLCPVLYSRTGLTHVAVAQLKRLDSLSAPWRGAMSKQRLQLASCGRSGSGVTVPYRNGLLEPMRLREALQASNTPTS
jgi:hypothetical protein